MWKEKEKGGGGINHCLSIVPFNLLHKSEVVSKEDDPQPGGEVEDESGVEEPVVEPVVPHTTHNPSFPWAIKSNALGILKGHTNTNLNFAIKNSLNENGELKYVSCFSSTSDTDIYTFFLIFALNMQFLLFLYYLY